MHNPSTQSPARMLRNAIENERILVTPGAYDAFSALVIENEGFPAIFISGYALSVSLLGKTDASFTNLSNVEEVTKNIARAVNIPVVVDADTGFGNAVNVAWTTKVLEDAGAAGIALEDQSFPKACAVEGSNPLIDAPEMVGKIRAAVDHRTDKDFVVIARTDALALEGLEMAISRGNTYRQAGADVIFVSTPPSVDLNTLKSLVKGIDAPVHTVLPEGTIDACLTVHDLSEAGIAWTTIPLTPMLAAGLGMQQVLRAVTTGRRLGTTSTEHMMSFAELQLLINSAEIHDIESLYSTPIKGC